jgi:uncharacterized protein
MKTLWTVVLLLSLCAVSQPAFSQASTNDGPCNVSLPGITFTRSLNGAAANARVEGGTLTLRSDAKRDYFREPDGTASYHNAPILLATVDNRQPFTLTAKITPTFLKTYDAGTLYIYVKDDLWLKMAMEMDERNKTRMVTVRTIGTSDDNNHDVITAKGVYMKISSDTKTVAFYYSLDKKTWQLMRLFKNEYPASIWLGVSAQSPLGEGTSAVFEELSLTKRSVSDFRLGI